MAYVSDKTRRREVYVASFPSGEGEVRISTDGGEQPRWRRSDGRELYYVALDGKMMSVKVKPTAGPNPSFERDTPVPLFDSRIATSTETRAFQYDVSADGRRFLVNTNVSTSSNSVPSITVVFNWWPK